MIIKVGHHGLSHPRSLVYLCSSFCRLVPASLIWRFEYIEFLLKNESILKKPITHKQSFYLPDSLHIFIKPHFRIIPQRHLSPVSISHLFDFPSGFVRIFFVHIDDLLFFHLLCVLKAMDAFVGDLLVQGWIKLLSDGILIRLYSVSRVGALVVDIVAHDIDIIFNLNISLSVKDAFHSALFTNRNDFEFLLPISVYIVFNQVPIIFILQRHFLLLLNQSSVCGHFHRWHATSMLWLFKVRNPLVWSRSWTHLVTDTYLSPWVKVLGHDFQILYVVC